MKLLRGRDSQAAETLLYVTFDTTTDALSFKSRATSCGLEGKLGMVPRTLSADCGMAWQEPERNEQLLIEAIDAEGEGCHGPHRV